MSHSKKDLLTEIDFTLDQLIQNAEVLSNISSNLSYEQEIDALHKTQESLLARLMHLDQSLEKMRCMETDHIRSKLNHYSILNPSINEDVVTYFDRKKKHTRKPLSKKPKIHTKRKKAAI
ncbi:MAG: hypothetical protein KAR79_03645 [Simkaniaceae bacterium]|nr:hypothetical protein [Simkaniaceae bacterium]